jgi:Na+/melibiose symporter-like transporter
MFVMGLAGFVEGAGAVQNATTVQAIWILFSIFPTAGVLISLPMLLKYRLKDKDVQIMARCNSGDLCRDEAQALFSHPY